MTKQLTHTHIHTHTHHCIRPASPGCQTTQTNHRKRKLQISSFYEFDAKILNKPNTAIHKKIIHHDQEGFIPQMQAQFNTQKINSNNTLHQQNKGKSQRIISMEREKALPLSHMLGTHLVHASHTGSHFILPKLKKYLLFLHVNEA